MESRPVLTVILDTGNESSTENTIWTFIINGSKIKITIRTERNHENPIFFIWTNVENLEGIECKERRDIKYRFIFTWFQISELQLRCFINSIQYNIENNTGGLKANSWVQFGIFIE